MEKQRIISNVKFLESLRNGKLKKIVEYVKAHDELDLQIRDNYINIYYRGGNILRIKSPNRFEFDKFYFYTEFDKMPKKSISKKKINDCTNKSNELLKKLKAEKIEGYFTEAKDCMDRWWKSMKSKRNTSHEEKDLQHKISRSNNTESTDYTVLDLEYQVSPKNDEIRYNGEKNKTMPRFDIVAIDNSSGQLCVMELKKGRVALKGKSGVEDHIDSFKCTIGRDTERVFVDEMRQLYKQKREFGLIDTDIELSNDKPEFIFVFQGSEPEREELEKLVNGRYKVIILKDDNIIKK